MVNGKWKSWRFVQRATDAQIALLARSRIDFQPGSSNHASFPDGTARAQYGRTAKSRDLRARSFQFTVDIVRFCRSTLTHDAILRRLAYQLGDSAGSVGANLEESGGGQTKPDFITKQFVALKEARESRFWLRVIAASEPRIATQTRPHLQESTELVAMLTASIKTAKSNPNRGEPQIVEEDED